MEDIWDLIWKMLARNKTSIFLHVQFLIRQLSYDGTISRFNRLGIHNIGFRNLLSKAQMDFTSEKSVLRVHSSKQI